MRRIGVFALAATVAALAVAAVLYSRPLTREPSAYARGTEAYYLAWVEHGTHAEQAGAAAKLLALEGRRDYALTKRLWERRRGLIRHMLLLGLFDLAPEQHAKDVMRLLTLHGQDGTVEGEWVKTDEVFEGETVDFFFDWGKEAAYRLIRSCRLSDRAMAIILTDARSYYPEDRRRAKAAFSLFPDMPAYDPAPQPRTINDTPALTRTQVDRIEAWLAARRGRLAWTPARGIYQSEAGAGGRGGER